MQLKPLKFWCGVSIPGAVLLTWVFPVGAVGNSVCQKGEKLQNSWGYICDTPAIQPDTDQVRSPESGVKSRSLGKEIKACPNEEQFKQVRGSNLCQTGIQPELSNPDFLSKVKTSETKYAQTPPKIPTNAPSPVPPEILKPDPNRDRFPQPAPVPIPEVPNTTPPVQAPPTPTPSTSPASGTIQVQKIRVTRSTVFGEAQFNPIIKTVEGRTVTLEELRGVADKITQLYLDRGFITSRAILADQKITNGVVEIVVIEGGLEKIEVQGTRRLQQSYVRSRIQLGAGTPLNTGKLEDQLRLLRADPLFENVEASLRAGEKQGQSILIVRVTEANPFVGSVGADNYSPPSIGSERFGVNLAYRNLTGRGDELAGSYYRTATGGADIFDFSYRLPVNAMNGTVQLRAAPNRNNVTQPPFDVFDIRGESQLYEISYRQPLIRSPREELALSIGYAYQSGQTFTFAGPTPFGFGPDRKGVSRTSVFKFGQDYLIRDVNGAWSLRSLFSLGTGIFNATIQPDPTPDGRFLSWLGQIQRVQIISPDNFLIISGDLQVASTSLLPSQQFVIGGGQSLRGYRQNARAGDNGFRLSIEDRITLQRNQASAAVLQLAPFADIGTVWNVAGDPNELPRQRFLAGLGLGLIWQPLTNVNVRLDYGIPLIRLKDKGNNIQDSGFYFSVNYQL